MDENMADEKQDDPIATLVKECRSTLNSEEFGGRPRIAVVDAVIFDGLCKAYELGKLEDNNADVFWKDILESVLEEDGETAAEAVRRELSDYYMVMEFAGAVYEHATGGRVSKLNTLPSAVCAMIDDYVNEIVEEAIKEAAGTQTCEECGNRFHHKTPCDDRCSECRLNMAGKRITELEAERDEQQAELVPLRYKVEAVEGERDKLASQVCDECTDGKGYGTLTKDGEEPRMVPCVCITETKPWQELEAEKSAAWHASIGHQERILELEAERDKLQSEVNTLIDQVAK